MHFVDMKRTVDVKKIRKSVGWTQSQLAAYVGVDRTSVSHMENGRPVSRPVEQLLKQLALGRAAQE